MSQRLKDGWDLTRPTRGGNEERERLITEVNTGFDEGRMCPAGATSRWAVAADAEKGEW